MSYITKMVHFLLAPNLGILYILYVRIFTEGTLKNFWRLNNRGDSEQPLKAWYREARQAQWNNPNEIKVKYKTASILRNNKVVFNIAGNKYRLIVHINYKLKIVDIIFIGTHSEYDKINVEKL
jgi:mRNA interferase HigB